MSELGLSLTDAIRIPVGPSGSPVAWATIDMEDYERVVVHRWYLGGSTGGYAFAPKAIDGKSVFLHGFIVGRLDEHDRLHIDHINRDRLDCRKRNLRVVTVSENVLNSERHDRRDELITAVRDLRIAGVSVAGAAVTVGVSRSFVSKCTSDLRRPPRGARGGTTYRAVERGIYRRQYKTTGIVLPGFFVNDLRERTFRRFVSLEDAREYRASGAWRRREQAA